NAVVLSEVPPNCTAVGVPARIVKRDGVRIAPSDLDWIHMPDPVSQQFCHMQAEIDGLRHKLDELDREKNGRREERKE
ncbi:MAG: serine O-acetyltransferase, partial [Eubacterium sp.]|nr:serine O-acetyltransferase [Eubacterium sp.]